MDREALFHVNDKMTNLKNGLLHNSFYHSQKLRDMLYVYLSIADRVFYVRKRSQCKILV